MVTTRSADKRTKLDGRTENLALRARTDDGPSTEQPTDPDTPSQSIGKRKAKVLVNVPPPTKRTRLSHDGADDVEGKNVSSKPSVEGLSAEQKPVPQSEIPDSQTTPEEAEEAEDISTQIDHTSKNDNVTIPPRSGKTPKRKQGAARSSKTTSFPVDAISIKPAVGSHKRFDSEEPVEAQPTAEGNSNNLAPGANDSSSSADEDEAPELASSKTAPSTGNLNAKRKPRAKANPNTAPKRLESTTNPKNSNESVVPNEGSESTTKPNTTPMLKIDTTQDSDAIFSEEQAGSDDSAFVTARTTRHVDVFATPQSDLPQIRSPSSKAVIQSPDSGHTESSVNFPGKGLISTVNSAAPRRRQIATIPDTEDSSTTKLPSKASNTLENYRRQKQQNTAQNIGTKFKLQDDWSTKRKQFVVSH